MFGAQIRLSANAFAVDHAGRLQLMREIAKRQGFHYEGDAVPLWEHLWSPIEELRLGEHMEMGPDLQGADGCYAFDAEHHPHFSTGGPCLPCLVKNSTIVIAPSTLLTPDEYLLSLGEALPSLIESKTKCYIADVWQGLSIRQKKQIAGNTWNLAQLGPWIFYVLCNVEAIC